MIDPGQGVALTKQSPVISMTKGRGAGGQMRVNLKWHQGGGKHRLFGLGGPSEDKIDLDLAAMWELTDGTKGVVQALGNHFGSIDRAPYIQLDADDRTGQSAGGENLTINLDHIDKIARVLIFAYIYAGAASFGDADGVVTLYPVGAPPVEVRLGADGGKSKSCGVAMLIPDLSGGLTVRREVKYVPGFHDELDAAFRWGMTYTKTTKD